MPEGHPNAVRTPLVDNGPLEVAWDVLVEPLVEVRSLVTPWPSDDDHDVRRHGYVGGPSGRKAGSVTSADREAEAASTGDVCRSVSPVPACPVGVRRVPFPG
jgi:hypothetical protein